MDHGWLADLFRADKLWINIRCKSAREEVTWIYSRLTQLIHIVEIYISLQSHPVAILMRCDIKTFSMSFCLWTFCGTTFMRHSCSQVRYGKGTMQIHQTFLLSLSRSAGKNPPCHGPRKESPAVAVAMSSRKGQMGSWFVVRRDLRVSG